MIDDPAYADVAADLRTGSSEWMGRTDDPLLDGPVPAPPGALINAQDQLSAEEETFVAGEAAGAATGR